MNIFRATVVRVEAFISHVIYKSILTLQILSASDRWKNWGEVICPRKHGQKQWVDGTRVWKFRLQILSVVLLRVAGGQGCWPGTCLAAQMQICPVCSSPSAPGSICVHTYYLWYSFLLRVDSSPSPTVPSLFKLRVLVRPPPKIPTLQTCLYAPLPPILWPWCLPGMTNQHLMLSPYIHSGLSGIRSGARPECSFQNANNYPDTNPAKKTLMVPRVLGKPNSYPRLRGPK